MASYLRLLAFTIVSSLACPLAASAQNSSDLRSLTIPASACEIVYTEFQGERETTGGGRNGGGATILAAANSGGRAVLVAFCPGAVKQYQGCWLRLAKAGQVPGMEWLPPPGIDFRRQFIVLWRQATNSCR